MPTALLLLSLFRRTVGRRPRACPEADERLVTLEELVAEFDHMLIRKGLMTGHHLALIRRGGQIPRCGHRTAHHRRRV